MANQNNNQNGYKKLSVTTNSLTLFDENGVMFKLSFFDDTFGVMICAPVMTAENKRSYPADARESFIITADRVSALYNDVIMEKVLPAISEKRAYNGGIFLNSRKDRVFEIMVKDDEIYGLYHIDIDENRKPKKSLVFKFSKTPIIEKYNPVSGEFEMPEVHSQFTLFVKTLEGFLLCINGVTAHTGRHINKFMTDKLFKQLEEIAVKLGISVAPSKNPFDNSDTSSGVSDGGFMPAMNETNDLNNLLLS